MATDKKDSKPLKLNYEGSSVLYTNHIAVTKASNEEVELALCIKSPDEKSADVTHRLIVSLPHFFRLREVFNVVGEDITKVLKKEEK